MKSPLDMRQETKRLDLVQDADAKLFQNKASFPSARYFQIHFEYIQEMMLEIKHQLDASNQKIASLEAQLREAIPIVIEENEQKY